MSAGLLLLVFAPTAPPPDGLQVGDEFTFTGTVVEAIERPGRRFRRRHELELRVLVLDRQEKWAAAAVLTRLRRADDAVSGAAGAVTGAGPDRAPPSVRLDLVRVHADGTVHLLTPPGPPPLRLTADTQARALPIVPLDTFAPSEFGVFPPRSPRPADPGETWTVASADPDRPAETWQDRGFEFVTAERCRLLLMNQKSSDWDRPVGGQTAWHRADAVWVSAQDGLARKVHRVVLQRDGRAEAPAAWVEVKYELKDQTRLEGRTYQRSRQDVEVAYTTMADAAALAPSAAQLGPRPFETRLKKLDDYLEEGDPASPYREAVTAARRLLDAARRGEVAPVGQTTTPAALVRPRWPEPGQLAPDFKAGPFRLADHRGKPVVLVFFRPGSETADLSLAVADALEKRHAGKVVVAALAVGGDAAAGIRDRDRLKLAVAIHDGTAAISPYAIETVPRFAVIGADGKVRWTFTGVGAETGFLVKEQADLLVAPTSQNGVAGTTPAAGPPARQPTPRP